MLLSTWLFVGNTYLDSKEKEYCGPAVSVYTEYTGSKSTYNPHYYIAFKVDGRNVQVHTNRISYDNTKVGQTVCFDLAYSEVYGTTTGAWQIIIGSIGILINVILCIILIISLVQFFIYDINIKEVIIVAIFNSDNY